MSLRFCLFLACFSLTACLTTGSTWRSSQDRCAEAGLIYAGFDITGVNDRGHDVGHIRCVPPKTEAEECEIRARKAKMAIEDRHYSKWNWRNNAVGIGYLFWIAPGAALYYYWKGENEKDYENLKEAKAQAGSECVAH